MDSPNIPAKIGRYDIKAELGRGGMATVYRGFDPQVKREVAVKVLPREFLHDPTFRTRFTREAETIAGLEHPAIVPLYDFGEDGGQPYFVMRLMPGGSLADRLKDGPLPVEECVRIVTRLARALDDAHSRGIIHRDLKPGNILFDSHNEPYVSDFGIAKLSQGGGTLGVTGSGIIGTPAYMSPEQTLGKPVGPQSDVYALGIILYEMLTGHQPYEADTPIAVALMHLSQPLPLPRQFNADIPDDVEEVVRVALEKETGDRYQTAGELAAALAATQPGAAFSMPTQPRKPTGKTILTAPPTTRPNVAADTRPQLPTSNSKLPIVVGAVILIIVAAVIGGMLLFARSQQSVSAEQTAIAAQQAAATAASLITQQAVALANVEGGNSGSGAVGTLQALQTQLAELNITAPPTATEAASPTATASATATETPTETPTVAKTGAPTRTRVAQTATPTETATSAVTAAPVAAPLAISNVTINFLPSDGLNFFWYLTGEGSNKPGMFWRLRVWRASNSQLLAEKLWVQARAGANSWTEPWFRDNPQAAGTEFIWNIEVCDGCSQLSGGWVGEKIVTWKEGHYWWGAAPETAPPSPIPEAPTAAVTSTPSDDPFVFRGPLSIVRVAFQYATRDDSRPNGAIAYIEVLFSGGQAPFTVANDGVTVLTGGIPNQSQGNPNQYWLLFPVATGCDAQFPATVTLQSADGQSASQPYFVDGVKCP
jgi:serine/threonine-protein kinase